jgi:capping protein beta
MADTDEAQINAALNIMRRMPPSQVENSLAGLIELAPQLTDDLLTHVDQACLRSGLCHPSPNPHPRRAHRAAQPLKLMKDPKTGKEFVLCDYNRDGDSHRCDASGASSARVREWRLSQRTRCRSPWSNEYFPPLDGFLPAQKLRVLEVEANTIFDHYRKMCGVERMQIVS